LVDRDPLLAVISGLQLGNRSVGESLLRMIPDHTVQVPFYWDDCDVQKVEPHIYRQLLRTCFEHREEVLSTGIDGKLYIDGPGFARKFDWDKAFAHLDNW
jgi:hypothetical protein